MMTFERALERVLAEDIEGGYQDGTGDLGGETKYGISKRAYPHLNIAELTRGHAAHLFRRDYWDRVRCGRLPSRLRLMMFDAAVNQGPVAAAVMLQRIVGATPDGIVGPRTLIAADQHARGYLGAAEVILVARFCLARLERYRNLAASRPKQRGNLLHWVYRTTTLCKESLS